MSAVSRDADLAASAGDVATPTATGRKKKLIVIGLATTLVLAAGGGGAAFYLMKQRAAAAAAEAEGGEGGEGTEEPVVQRLVKATVKSAPTFVALDPFTVNLADREAERYAQVGISFELGNPKDADLLKAYMPAIRNNILLALGAKSTAQLNERDGKLRLADEIRREALRPLGYELSLPPAAGAPAVASRRKAAQDDDADEALPIRAVHFSNFIIQ